MSQWLAIGPATGFTEEATAVHAGGLQIAVFRLGEELFALKDLCTHGNARLSDGYVEHGCVECPLHQGLFDIRSGEPRSAPITEAVRSFPIRIVEGIVEIDTEIDLKIDTDDRNHVDTCSGCNPPAPVKLKTEITSISRPSEDVAIVTLACNAMAIPQYRAGQYMDVLMENGPRRSYSMATPARAGLLEWHIRHMPGGSFTGYVFNAMKVGDQLTLEGPAGNFWLRDGTEPVVLLASGTGFAPIKAIVEQAISDGLQRPMVLYWGGRVRRDLYLDALCRTWASTLAWFDYIPVLSDAAEDSEWRGRTGFVHEAVMQDFSALSGHQVYACGAPAMVAAAQHDLIGQRGLSRQAFFTDAFVSNADRR